MTRPSQRTALSALALVLAAAVHFAWIRPTNFLGFDEWMVLWLTSRGIVSQPHAGRLLPLLWCLPAVWVAPHRLLAFHVLFGAYLALSGVLVMALVHMAAPRWRVLGALAGCLAATWAPLDYQRLATVHMTLYGGVVFGTLLALVLFHASIRRSNPWLLAAAVTVALVVVCSYEGTLPLLLVPPLAGAAFWPGFRRRRTWAAVWTGGLAAGLTPFVAASLRAREGGLYQESYALDLSPFRVARRLLQHHAFDLAPVVSPPWPWAGAAAVAAACAAVLLLVVAGRGEGAALGAEVRRPAARLAAAGLGLAALAHLPFASSAALTTPNRTQFLCAPGTGVFLASCLVLAASLAPAALRLPALALMSAWVMAVSATRTAAHQQTWDARTAYPAQTHLLSSLVSMAPDLKPNTLVVLLDGRGAWPDTYSFDHAVRYLYADRARGHVWRARNLFYPTRFEPDRIRREPRSPLRAAWGEAPSVHGYDETIAVRFAADGSVELLERWPARVAVARGAAAYDPRSRIVPGAPGPPSRRILRCPSWPTAACEGPTVPAAAASPPPPPPAR